MLDSDDGILPSKITSTSSGGEAVYSVRGERTSLFTIGVNRAVYSVAV